MVRDPSHRCCHADQTGSILHWPGHGVTKVVGSTINLSDTIGRVRGAYPELGEPTGEILLKLGYSGEDIVEMMRHEASSGVNGLERGEYYSCSRIFCGGPGITLS